MSSKPKKSTTPWFKCEKCSTNVLSKDIEKHSDDCPPDQANVKYNFVKNSMLYGSVDLKLNEEIKSVAPFDRDHMVFLSQSVIQLCSLCIGEKAVVRFLEDTSTPPIARTVWPTTEKLLTSVLLTKNDMKMLDLNVNTRVVVKKASPDDAKLAANMTVVLLNGPKGLEFSTELSNRLKNLHLNHLVTAGNRLSCMYYGKLLCFEIKSIETVDAGVDEDFQNLNLDGAFYRVVENTRWILFKDKDSYSRKKETKLPALGGLQNEINEVKHLMEVALGTTRSNFKLTKGVLLFGTSGTGKTLFAKTLAKECKANVLFVSSSDVFSKTNNADEELGKKIRDALDFPPSLIVLDEIDILCPTKGNNTHLTSVVLNIMDEINGDKNSNVFVLATTNKLENVDATFRKPERFGREIEFPVPNPYARKEILEQILKEVPNDLNQEDVANIAFNTHGFVGADLLTLVTQASLIASKNFIDSITKDDIRTSLVHVKPSAMRQIQIEVANVKWSDIGGQENLKLILRQAVEWPLKHPQSFKRLGITPPRGVLMYGPPGCSKTMIAKALATETRLNFLSIKGPELFSKWVGESERAVREVFRKARQVAPSIIFFDEIDAIGGERTSNSNASVQERVLAQLLTELDGVTPLGDVTVLAATNRPDRIDKALTRPGRLDRIVHVPLPDESTRREIFKIKISKMATCDIDIKQLTDSTEGHSGAEVNAICHEAAMLALEENIEASQVEMRHFTQAMHLVKPRTSQSLLKIYNEYAANIN